MLLKFYNNFNSTLKLLRKLNSINNFKSSFEVNTNELYQHYYYGTRKGGSFFYCIKNFIIIYFSFQMLKLGENDRKSNQIFMTLCEKVYVAVRVLFLS